MAETPHFRFWYPSDHTGPADGPALAQTLAQSIEDRLRQAFQAGYQSVTPSAANTVTTARVTFTTPFIATPTVVITPNTGVPHAVSCSVTDVSVTGFYIALRRTDTTPTVVNWVAIGR